MAMAAGALQLSPLEAVARGLLPGTALGPDYYPPALTGIRGSHAGSFEVAHALAREGHRFPIPREQSESTYDLVVVGGGISGLSAAKFFLDRQPQGRILVLDNHDDFGGHARRNELDVDGRTLIGYGGSQTIDTPSAYSTVARQLLQDIGVEIDRFYDYYDQAFFSRRGMGPGIYFDKPTFGSRALTPDVLESAELTPLEREAAVRAMPIPAADQDAFIALLAGGVDYLAGRSTREKTVLLRNISYLGFLEQYAGMPESVRETIRDSFLPMVGVGWEAASAWEALQYGFPGTAGLGIVSSIKHDEPYIHHFPDGNASIARLLVRKLIPDAMPGHTMEDLVTARANYAALDRGESPVRIRLNSTAVNARNTADGKGVDVTYVCRGSAYRVRAKHVVMACYNGIIPHLCPELPDAQAEAIRYATKVPFVVGSFALRNWRAFADAGYFRLYSPGDVMFKYVRLDFPVSLGNYRYAQDPDEPIVVTAWYCPTQRGLDTRDQYRAGRARLLQLSYRDFESDIFRHFDGMLGQHGFDADRDIAAITLNRWPHGYAYEFEGIGVPAEYGRYSGPHIAGRARLGRISIANSDSEAYAYADGAIDAAHRAVNEQLAL